MAGDAYTDRYTDLHRLHALRDLRPEISRFGIDEKEARSFGVHHLRGAVDDLLQQFVNVQFRGDRLHHLEERFGNFHAFPDLLIQHRVANSDAGLRGEGLEQLLIFSGEGAALFIEKLEDANDLVGGVLHGHAEDASRGVPGPLVYLAIETRIGIGIGNINDLAA